MSRKINTRILTKLFTVLLASAMVLTMIPVLSAPVFAGGESGDLDSHCVNGYIPMLLTYEMDGKTMVKDFDQDTDDASGKRTAGSGEALPDAYRSDKEPWAAGVKVKDQNITSLCWAYSMTTASEYSYAKEVYENTGDILALRPLSAGHLGQFYFNRINDPLGNTYGDSNGTPSSVAWPLYGGNAIFAMQHAATWSGLALEEKYPLKSILAHIIGDKNYRGVWDGTMTVYPASGAYDDELVQQESIVLLHPIRNKIKELIYRYGAVSAAMEFDYLAFMNLEEINPETGKTYPGGKSYYNYNKKFSATHAVTIVGWDDNYPKENFSHVIQEKVDEAKKAARATAETEARARAEAEAEEIYKNNLLRKKKLIRQYVDEHLDEYIEEIVAAAAEQAEAETMKLTTPDSDGAWIVQNSWGNVHDHGFLYVSYEDIDLNTESASIFAFDMQPVDTYKYNFQYDGNAINSDSSDKTTSGKHLDYYTKPGTRAANVYTNTTGEPVNIEAVGYTTFRNGSQEYDVSIYTGLKDPADPTSGKFCGTTRISTSTRGCKTAELDKPVYVAPGDTYSIVFDFTDFSAFGIETDAISPYFIFEAETAPGQSFFNKSGTGKWTDMYKYDACFRIKGFANPTELIPADDTQGDTPSESKSDVQPASKTTLPVPAVSKVKAGKKSVTVKWTKLKSSDAKKISGIEIQYSTSKSFKKGVKTVTAKATAASKTIKNLKAKKKYYIRVRSYKKVSGIKKTSKWSKIKSVRL